ncbi:MAG: ABC transporter permease [[Eubacterium] brachy]|jgi:Cell division protein|nr:putative cell division protein FtsX [Eubacterium brachy ATCC 33089]MBF1133624.1 ABC transporter permease [[Eubacterium] brachy]
MSKFMYAFRQTIKQVKRNKGMAFTSVFAIAAMLIILGIFMMIIVNINTAAEVVKQDYNNIEIFFKDSVKTDDILKLQKEIAKWKEVDEVKFRSKDDALKILKKRWGENGYLLNGLASNPLPNSLVLTVDKIEKSDAVAKKAEKVAGVEDVKYYQDTIKKLVSATRGFQIATVVIMAFLIVIATVVVSNTIKLTVFNRSDEIVIMKYVGATNWFIRAPFLLEGILIGIVSSLLASGIVMLIYKSISKAIGDKVLAILSTPMVPAGFLSVNIILIFLALGVSIGAWGSIISMRRFLDTN